MLFGRGTLGAWARRFGSCLGIRSGGTSPRRTTRAPVVGRPARTLTSRLECCRRFRHSLGSHRRDACAVRSRASRSASSRRSQPGPHSQPRPGQPATELHPRFEPQRAVLWSAQLEPRVPQHPESTHHSLVMQTAGVPRPSELQTGRSTACSRLYSGLRATTCTTAAVPV